MKTYFCPNLGVSLSDDCQLVSNQSFIASKPLNSEKTNTNWPKNDHLNKNKSLEVIWGQKFRKTANKGQNLNPEKIV